MAEGSHEAEISAGERFRFGENWAHFLTTLTEQRIADAEASLRSMLQVEDLHGRSFLDIGSGSGFFSLAARRLGATVLSFDYDPSSVACTQELKRRYFENDDQWQVRSGSVLDDAFMQQLGSHDVVYSWGVLHHTGNMQQAIAHACARVAAGGTLYLAIYNDQGWISDYWTVVKKIYNKGAAGGWLMIVVHAPYLLGARFAVRAFTGRLRMERGMSLWHDMIDWLGGYPFEVASPETLRRAIEPRGFRLTKIKTCGRRMGCNEFVFDRAS